MLSTDTVRRNLPAIGAATRLIIIMVTVLSIPLTAAEVLGLSEKQTSSWILAIYGLPAFLSLVMSITYRQPILLTGNIFMIIFIAQLADRVDYPDVVGASILAGVAVLLLSILGLTAQIAALIPMPIVFGLLAGAVTPFVVDIFTIAGNTPLLVGGTFLTYLASRYLLGKRIPAIVPALIAGLIIAALTDKYIQTTISPSVDIPAITRPEFELSTILNLTPVFIILITLQANLPSLRFMESQDYDPPEFAINSVSGVGTVLGSFLGPTGVSLSLPATSLVAGPDAGELQIRYRSVYLAGGAALFVGLLSGLAADLKSILPLPLLTTLVGLAVVDVLSNALKEITQGPVVLGPLFAFVIALSDISLLGFGPFFWSLVIGTAITRLLEQDALQQLHKQFEIEEDVQTKSSRAEKS